MCLCHSQTQNTNNSRFVVFDLLLLRGVNLLFASISDAADSFVVVEVFVSYVSSVSDECTQCTQCGLLGIWQFGNFICI